MKKIVIVAIVLLCVACSQQKNPAGDTKQEPTKEPAKHASSLAGYWVWEKDSKVSSFEVEVTKKDNVYIGQYCAVALSGNRIDCAREDDPPSFKIENVQGNEFTVNFKTYYTEGTGKVKIRVEGDTMYWKVIEEPDGEYYGPDDAVLKRTDKEKALRDVLK